MQQRSSETSTRAQAAYFTWGNQQKDRSFFPQENRQDKVKISKETAFCHSTSAGIWSSGRHCRVCGRSQGLNAMRGYLPPTPRPASCYEAWTLPRGRYQQDMALAAHLPTSLSIKAPARGFAGSMPHWLPAPNSFPLGTASLCQQTELSSGRRRFAGQGNDSIWSPSLSSATPLLWHASGLASL